MYNINNRLRKSVDNRIWKYLINRKKKFYTDINTKTDIFNLDTLDDVFQNYPGLNLESIYLAGGMDKAKDVGAGWRLVVENEFEKQSGKNSNLPLVDLGGFGKVKPKRVVDNEYLELFIEKPNEAKELFCKPLILNPVRKEIDRTKIPEFATAAKKYKTFDCDTEPEEYDPTMKIINKILSSSIEPGDEHIVRLGDAIFLGLNTVGSAGTFGELQTASLMNKPIFVWMTDDNWSFSDFSMWTFPHISKIARNEEEMKKLVQTIMKHV